MILKVSPRTHSVRGNKLIEKMHKIDLLRGSYSKRDALDLLTQLIHVKIRFHESRISADMLEEDLKMRENRIHELQRDLYEAGKLMERLEEPVSLEATIQIS
jgi:hypothetical protein